MTTPNPMNHQPQPPTQPPPMPQYAPPQNITVNVQDRKRVNHWLHFILTCCTLGVWLPVWAIQSIRHS